MLLTQEDFFSVFASKPFFTTHRTLLVVTIFLLQEELLQPIVKGLKNDIFD